MKLFGKLVAVVSMMLIGVATCAAEPCCGEGKGTTEAVANVNAKVEKCAACSGDNEQVLPKVIDFAATWCGPCRVLSPILARLENKYAGRVLVERVDIDESPERAVEAKIQVVPTLLFVCPDGTTERVEGLPGIDEPTIENQLDIVFKRLLGEE